MDHQLILTDNCEKILYCPFYFVFGFDSAAGGVKSSIRSDALHLFFQNGHVNWVTTFFIIVCMYSCRVFWCAFVQSNYLL